MNNKKYIIAIIIVLLTLGGIFALSNNKDKSESKNEKKDMLVYMILDKGGVNDESFNQSAWKGAMSASEKYNVDVKYLESTQDSDYASNIETAVDLGADLIIGVGFNLSSAIEEAALNYEDQKFAIIDGTFEQIPSNVKSITFSEEQAGYLAGLIAGQTSKSDKFGFIGGLEVPAVVNFKIGFEKGIKEVNKNAVLYSQYANSFTDASKGKAIANQMYSSGIEIIMTAGGGVNMGVYDIATDLNKYAVGVDMEQNKLSTNNILTSALKRVDVGVESTIKDLAEGKFVGGIKEEFDIKNGGVGYEKTSIISEDIVNNVNKKIEELKK